MKGYDFLKRLAQRATLLGDGAMGTELYKRGLPAGCLEKYNITYPAIVRDIHLSYYEAGSDIVETNSFGGNRARLQAHGLAEKLRDFNLWAVQLARQACPSGKFVGGSIGPTGEDLEPFGEFKRTEARDIFSEQADILAEGGVDVIYIETMVSLEETEIAVLAAKEKTDLPVVASMTFEVGKAGSRTSWGNSLPEVVKRLNGSGADVIGVNCGRGFAEMVIIAKELRSLTTKPIIVQPNSGLPKWVEGFAVYDQTPESIRSYAEQLLNMGVNILGGCCGTGPEHVRMMRELIDLKA